MGSDTQRTRDILIQRERDEPRGDSAATSGNSRRAARRCRVFQLIKSLGRGGAETLLPETLRFSDRDRFEYRYAYFLPWKDAMVPELQAQKVRVDCIEATSSFSILMKARKIARLLREWDADILHCHLPIAGVVGRLAGKLASVPVVYTEHNVQERYHPFTRRANLATWRWQQEVIAVSSDVADSLQNWAPAPVPVKIILNGVDVDRFDRARVSRAALRARLGIPSEAPVVGTVAVFRIQKRLDDWLEAGRMLLDRHPEIRFLLVGDGPLRPELVAKAEALGIDGSLHWTGLQEDVRPYLAAMDVYMMSSVFEGLPIALLEAMSMRCAVVCTAVGGIPEVIREGVNGHLVSPGDPRLLVDAVGGLFQSRARMKRMAAAARKTVVERFSIERMSREIEASYNDAVRSYEGGR